MEQSLNHNHLNPTICLTFRISVSGETFEPDNLFDTPHIGKRRIFDKSVNHFHINIVPYNRLLVKLFSKCAIIAHFIVSVHSVYSVPHS